MKHWRWPVKNRKRFCSSLCSRRFAWQFAWHFILDRSEVDARFGSPGSKADCFCSLSHGFRKEVRHVRRRSTSRSWICMHLQSAFARYHQAHLAPYFLSALFRCSLSLFSVFHFLSRGSFSTCCLAHFAGHFRKCSRRTPRQLGEPAWKGREFENSAFHKSHQSGFSGERNFLVEAMQIRHFGCGQFCETAVPGR